MSVCDLALSQARVRALKSSRCHTCSSTSPRLGVASSVIKGDLRRKETEVLAEGPRDL